jgi:hypothetical protein
MSEPYHVYTSSQFDRLSLKLSARHPTFVAVLEEAIGILTTEPKPKPQTDGGQEYDIIKLTSRPVGDGQYRLKLKRWRFLYDIADRNVELLWCGLRNEHTY